MRVALETGERASARRREGQPLQDRRCRVPTLAHTFDGAGTPGHHGFHEGDQGRLVLSADDRVAAALEQILGIERGVEAVEADVAAWIHTTDLLRHAHPESERGVHGYRDGDEAGTHASRRLEGLHGDVEGLRGVPRPLEEGERRGQGQGLMPQLIAGDEEYRPLLHLSAPWR